MKKFIAIVLGCLALFGCSCTDMGATNAVTDYLNQYKNLSDDVLADLDDTINNENLSDKQKDVYKEILKKQYQDIQYEIIDEKYNGDAAVVTAKITVYDLYKAQNDAQNYMKENMTEFYDDEDIYDNSKYLDYKLDQMKKMTDTTTYTIDFNVNKNDDKWTVEQPSQTDLEKIHGIYNYEQ